MKIIFLLLLSLPFMLFISSHELDKQIPKEGFNIMDIAISLENRVPVYNKLEIGKWHFYKTQTHEHHNNFIITLKDYDPNFGDVSMYVYKSDHPSDLHNPLFSIDHIDYSKYTLKTDTQSIILTVGNIYLDILIGIYWGGNGGSCFTYAPYTLEYRVRHDQYKGKSSYFNSIE